MKGKINWISILQGWAILWVIVGHSTLDNVHEAMPDAVAVLYGISYSFNMPLFAAVSGFLFYITRLKYCDGKWKYSDILQDKIVRLLPPAIFFSAVAYLLKMAFPGDMERPVSCSVSYFFDILLHPGHGPLGEIWFVVSLMWFFVLTPLWKLVLRHPVINVLCLVILASFSFFSIETDFLCIGDALPLSFYFALGITFGKYAPNISFGKKSAALALVSAVVYFFSFRWDITLLKPLSGIILSVTVALAADRFLPQLFCTFRDYYYQIFLMGIFVQISIKMIYHHSSIPYFVAYLLAIIAGIYVPVLVAGISKKISSKPLSIILGIK